MNYRQESRINMLNWYAAMFGAGKAMSEGEMQGLLDWEAENLDGCTVGTSDWPGWGKYIGPKPIYSDEARVKDEFGYVDLIRAESGEYKIGRSKDVSARMRNFATLAPFNFELIHTFPAHTFWKAERKLQNRYRDKRIKGEWYRLDQTDVEAVSRISRFKDGKLIE